MLDLMDGEMKKKVTESDRIPHACGDSMHTIMISKNLEQTPTFYTLWDKRTHTMLATALVTHDNEGHGLLWIIEVSDIHRRKGYGRELLLDICSRYEVVETQWLNPEGRALCKSAGFEEFDNRLMVYKSPGNKL